MEKKSPSQESLKEIENLNYFPGKLLLIMNEYFNNQKNSEKVCKNISFWEAYVSQYFNPKIIYCAIMNQDNNQWIFKSGYETLPLIFKEKYCENMSLVSVCLDGPDEYILSPNNKEEGNRYMLKINKLSKIEKYGDKFTITNGILTVIFDKYLKIVNYEFQSLSHKKINNEDNTDDISLNDFGLTPQFSRTLVISEVLTEMQKSIDDYMDKFI